MRRPLLLLLGMSLLVGCQELADRRRSSAGDAAGAVDKDHRGPIGRFQLLQGVAHLSSGKDVPVTLRVDTQTGATWSLAADGNRWIGVEDDLQSVGTYNRETKKVEWGVKVPDGRDLNELSKDELVRYLSAAIRNRQRPNPKDPLGLFEAEKPK